MTRGSGAGEFAGSSIRGVKPRVEASGLRRIASLVVCALLTSSCYSYMPVASAAGSESVGGTVGVLLNDLGRFELAEVVGPRTERLEGVITYMDTSGFTLAVERVEIFGGRFVAWSGEKVVLSRRHVATIERKKFDKRRTLFAAGSVVVATTVFVVTRSLLGKGTPTEGPPGPPPDDQ